MAGDGLVPPLNAPPAGQIMTGVQPGVTNGIIIANIVIIFGPTGSATGLFVYQPGTTPGSGNPPIAWITANSKDPYGNTVQPGIMLAEASGTGNAEGGLIWNTATPGAAEPLLALYPNATVGFTGNAPFVLGRVFNRGLVNEQLGLAFGGGGTAGSSPVQFEVLSASKDGTIPLNVQLFSPSGESWQVGGAQTDSTPITVTAAAITRITKAWPITANDAQVGTVYRLKAFGTGTQGSTQQNLTTDGNTGHPSLIVAGTIIGVSQGFSWESEAEMRVTATGSGGTADMKTAFKWQAAATGTTSNTWSGVQASTAVAFNTTIAQTSQIRMQWASTTGAPTITCYGSTFERLGL